MSDFTTQFSGSLIDTKMPDAAVRGDSPLVAKRDVLDKTDSFARELSKANDKQRPVEHQEAPARRQRANAPAAGETSSGRQRATSPGNEAPRKLDEDPRVAHAAELVDEADPSGAKIPGAESEERLLQSNVAEVDSYGILTTKQTAQADDGLLTPNVVVEEVVSAPADKLPGSDKVIVAVDVDSLAAMPGAAPLPATGAINGSVAAQPLGKANTATLSTLQGDKLAVATVPAPLQAATVSAAQISESPTSVAASVTALEPDASVRKLTAVPLNTASTGVTGKTPITANVIEPADTVQGAVVNSTQIKVQQQAATSSPALNVAETVSSSVTVNQLRQFSTNGAAKPVTPAGETVMADEVLDTAQSSVIRSVKPIADKDLDGSATRDNGPGRSMDMFAFSQVGSGKDLEISASQLRVGQLTALSTQTVADKSTEAALPSMVAEANAGVFESELPSGVKQVLKSGVQGEGVLGLGAMTTNVASSSLPDNMLVDSSSGIVTAPLLTRTDTVSTQIVSTPLPVPLMLPAANEAMTSNINWMVKEGVQNASVNVMPAGMGPISVNIGIENEQMNVSIVATQGTTREALEALLPRLREQLLTQGHDSVRVEISDGKSDQARGNNAQSQNQNQSPAYERSSFGGEQSADRNSDQSQGQTHEQTQSGSERLSSESGERPLTDAERARVASLSLSSAGSTPIQHGYDLYV